MIFSNDSDSSSRATEYTAEIGAAICDRLVEGESLHGICFDPAMPTKATVLDWLRRHQAFNKEYAYAQWFLNNCFEEELLEIADESGDGWMEKVRSDGRVVRVEDVQLVARCRLRIDVRCWVADRRIPANPVKYSTSKKGHQ